MQSSYSFSEGVMTMKEADRIIQRLRDALEYATATRSNTTHIRTIDAIKILEMLEEKQEESQQSQAF